MINQLVWPFDYCCRSSFKIRPFKVHVYSKSFWKRTFLYSVSFSQSRNFVLEVTDMGVYHWGISNLCWV